MNRHYTAALPIAFVSLKVLIIANLLVGLGIVVLLFLPHEQWIMKELDLAPSAEADRIVMGLRAVAILGIAAVPINHLILTRLVAMVHTVRKGDPFVAENAQRLQWIAWLLLALQIISMVIGGIATAVSTPEHPLRLDSGFSISGWLAVLLTFILARVFAEGTLMRADLEGTI